MTSWTVKPIGEVVTRMRTGSTPPTSQSEYFGGDVPWFTPGDIGSSKDLTASSRTITKDAISAGKAKLFEKGMLLVTCIGEIGRVGVLQQSSSSNQQITALKFPNEISPDFAYYWFIANQHKLANFANQAIVPILNNDRFSDIEFAYPPLDEQQRIAARLAKADRLRRLRRYASRLGESYLQSVFLEMFGDPAINPKGWKTVRIGDKLNFITSGSRGWAKYYAEKGDLFLRVQNLGANRLLLDDVAYVQAPDNAESKRTKVKAGDLLLSATADLGRTGVIPNDFPATFVNQHLFILRLKKDLNPYFVAGYYSTEKGKAQILRLDREGVKSGLNFDDVRSLRIFYPPLAEQERFAAIVARYERLRAQMSEGERQTQMLFQSLLSQSFGG